MTTLQKTLLFIGGLLCVAGGGVLPDVTRNDVLTQSYANDRSSKLKALIEMQTQEFASDDDQMRWWNNRTDTDRANDFKPFTDALAEAIFAEKVEDLIGELQ